MFDKKAKRLFEDWWIESETYKQFFEATEWSSTEVFYTLPLSMQWGVILEFADSLGYDLNAFPVYINKSLGLSKRVGYVYHLDKTNYDYESGTRKEAQQEAIKKLNDLINKDYV